MGYDVEAKINCLVNQVHEIANGTASKQNVMYLYGDDFAFENAYAMFQ